MKKIAQKIISEKTASLELIKGYKEDGTAFYAYVVLREYDADIMREQKNGLKLPKNCIILHSDFGHNVTDGIEEEIIKEFNALLKSLDGL